LSSRQRRNPTKGLGQISPKPTTKIKSLLFIAKHFGHTIELAPHRVTAL